MAHRILILVLTFATVVAPAGAQTLRDTPHVNGPVSALLLDGATLYVGGTFTAAGRAGGPLSFASSDDGRILRSHPGVTGSGSPEIRAVLADGAGGWYAGGRFERVDGLPRGALVRLLADGTVDPDFHVELSGVEALARHGSTLWVGGADGLIALDAASGAALPIEPFTWRSIQALEVSGDRLYAVGRDGLVALDASTGRREDWPTRVGVQDVAVEGGIVYVAGSEPVALRGSDGGVVTRFPFAGASAVEVAGGVVVLRGASGLRAFDPVTGVDRGWFGGVTGDGPIATDGTRLYTAGPFTSFDLRDGSAVPWTPSLLGGPVHALEAAEGAVAIGGASAAVEGAERTNLAAFDLRTGAVKSFAPELHGAVRALHKAGGALYAGGSFDGHLAALDAATGMRLPFPQAGAPVLALAGAGDTLFVGGERGMLGGTPTDGLGAVSLSANAALPWAPSLGCAADALAVDGTTVHAGGCFGLRAFRELAEVPAPAISGRVRALVTDGSGGLWVGGEFAGGNLAHFDPAGTGLVDSPVTDGPVHALALAGTTLHIGGRFTRVQDAPRLNVAHVNLVGGAVAGFNPRPAGTVDALAAGPGDALAIGGAFGSTWDATTGGLAVFGDPPPAKVRPPGLPTRVKSRVSARRGSPARAARR